MAKVRDSKCLKLISAMLIGSMLLAGCAKTEETTKKKKDKKSSKDSQKESTAMVEDEDSFPAWTCVCPAPVGLSELLQAANAKTAKAIVR